MKKFCMIVLFFALIAMSANAQKIAIKSNVAGYAVLTPNLGVEIALWPKITLDVNGLFNPWKWNDKDNLYTTKSTRFWAVGPELRYWFCYKFFRSFIGIHGQYGEYDCGLDKYNYDGFLYGAGFSYGYVLPMSKRLRMELNLGLGWNHMDYEKTDRHHRFPGDVVYYDPVVSDKFGITRAGVRFIFIIH